MAKDLERPEVAGAGYLKKADKHYAGSRPGDTQESKHSTVDGMRAILADAPDHEPARGPYERGANHASVARPEGPRTGVEGVTRRDGSAQER